MNGEQANALQRQIMDLTGEIRQLRKRVRRHERQHQADEQDRIQGRRRLATLVVAAIAAVDAPLVTLFVTYHH